MLGLLGGVNGAGADTGKIAGAVAGPCTGPGQQPAVAFGRAGPSPFADDGPERGDGCQGLVEQAVVLGARDADTGYVVAKRVLHKLLSHLADHEAILAIYRRERERGIEGGGGVDERMGRPK